MSSVETDVNMESMVQLSVGIGIWKVVKQLQPLGIISIDIEIFYEDCTV